MTRITLLSALQAHAGQAQSLMLRHLSDHFNTPGSEGWPTWSRSTPDVLHLMAQSTQQAVRTHAAVHLGTRYEDLEILAKDPDTVIAEQAAQTLRTIDEVLVHLADNRSPAGKVVAELLNADDGDTVWMGRLLTGPTIMPELEHFLTHSTFDLPDTFTPSPAGVYSADLVILSYVVHFTGRATLDLLDLTPVQTILIAAMAANQSTNLHHATRSMALHYQHLFTSDLLDKLIRQAHPDLISLHDVQTVETLITLLNMIACTPQATTTHLQHVADLVAGMNRMSCHAAEHPNASTQLRDAIINLSPNDHILCSRRISGTPPDAHQKAVDSWGVNTKGSSDWYIYAAASLGPESLLDLAENHVDWADVHWAGRWAALASDILDERHLERLDLNALSHLAQHGHDGHNYQFHNEDSVSALAAKRLARLLEPTLTRDPTSIHLVTRLSELPGTIDQLDELSTSVHTDHRIITAPASSSPGPDLPGRARA